jgi:hypothetical protein
LTLILPVDFGRHLRTKRNVKKSAGTLTFVERRLESQSSMAQRRSLLLISTKQPKTPKLRLKSCKQLIARLRLLKIRSRSNCTKRRLLHDEWKESGLRS